MGTTESGEIKQTNSGPAESRNIGQSLGRAEFVVGSYDFLNAHAIWSWIGEFRLSRFFNGVN